MLKFLIVIIEYNNLGDGTGKISVNDIERLCFKYFGGSTDTSNQKQQKGETIELSPI